MNPPSPGGPLEAISATASKESSDTCADYAYNPRAYNPARSISQAILRFGKTVA